MRRTNFGLLLALSILAFMAVASEKKILVAEGYAYTRDELDLGGRIFDDFCRNCHRGGDGGAPAEASAEALKKGAAQDMTVLITHAVQGFQGKNGWMPPKGGATHLTPAEVALAVAYMVKWASDREPR